ncbi:MAG: PAC2 family protein [Microbacteriaceae bacterium]
MNDADIFRHRVLLVAFEGWNDAGDAASTAVTTIQENIDVTPLLVMESETYYDYQYSRPLATFDDDGNRDIHWPTTTFYGPRVPGESSQQTESLRTTDLSLREGDIYLLSGIEPSRNWQTFVSDIVEMCLAVDIGGIVLLGAMLADVPHTRNIPVFMSSENAGVRSAFGAERSSYEGPTGIIGVLAHAAEAAGIPTMSLWASVPHYVHHGPCPKAALALLDKVESVIDEVIPRGNLEVESREWQENVDRLATEDDDMASYIATLEQQRDMYDSPEASGESIAEEFERFLRGRDNRPPDTRG